MSFDGFNDWHGRAKITCSWCDDNLIDLDHDPFCGPWCAHEYWTWRRECVADVAYQSFEENPSLADTADPA